MKLKLTECPSCGKRMSPAIRRANPESKWWQPSATALYCSECGIRLRVLDDKRGWWYIGVVLIILSELIEGYFRHQYSIDNIGAIALGLIGCAFLMVGVLTRRYGVGDRR